ncbi:unnamed protein product [Fusarium graminearum]|uniref:Chromosome 4, complete genome n=2 Tax=Gibberella zeae TaxID=5518 RepID=I1S9R7_GIBZE|nr:hypothetical protein FGSG_13598 [Fusarium graminearum PH-1]EYB31283.1 hypothetical protein FG05_13598 [Fusarium graminearum]ESU16090.1 hypothetical protein FGSG_13598 [Fusarium graminearum PH-1]CAF3505239.1 unnamed protein product [Fusarium graminearum]CAF3539313.1 unnamed protein product [Fusarium graminearum]CAF3631120.1 unnamed protein product [Fusarium graminearum]|eukprot:XP_011328226.1 hypothetical protein FGSG_13598 [Fusarium graminearum PH-1]
MKSSPYRLTPKSVKNSTPLLTCLLACSRPNRKRAGHCSTYVCTSPLALPTPPTYLPRRDIFVAFATKLAIPGSEASRPRLRRPTQTETTQASNCRSGVAIEEP